MLWYVNNLKISHANKEVVEDILKKSNNKFRKESLLTTCHRKVLEYLGMKIDYRQQGKVKFIMHDYINKLLEELPTDMQGKSTTPHPAFYFLQIQDARN